MNTQRHSSPREPVFARPTLARRLAFAFAAIVASATLLGGELSLFEIRASDAAQARSQTTGASSSMQAAGKVRAPQHS